MSYSTNPEKSLTGAWELISGSYVGEDQTVVDYSRAGIKSIKVLSERKFSFVTTAQGAFYAAGSGDYICENGLYTEIPILASHPDMIDKHFEFQYRLEGDIWENSRWQNGVRVEHEIWKRIQ